MISETNWVYYGAGIAAVGIIVIMISRRLGLWLDDKHLKRTKARIRRIG
jgi:hypothetical protein